MTTAQLSEGTHTHRASATMFLGTGTSSRSSESHCPTAVKAALLREAKTSCAQPPAHPLEHSSSDGHVAPQRHNSCPQQSAPSRELGCSISSRELLALSAASLGHSRLQQTLSECSRRELEPSSKSSDTGGAHCVLSPWHLGGRRRSPDWEQGNCKDCIMYNLPLWVQGRFNTGCSLPQEQHFLGLGLALVAVLWKAEEKQMSHVLGDLLCRRCLCFFPAHLSQKSCYSSGMLHGGAFP